MRILVRICECISLRVEKGERFDRAVNLFARRLSGHFYRSNGRPVRLSKKTIIRCYYAWKNGGKSPVALAMHYRSVRKVGCDQLFSLAEAAARPGILTFRAAFLCISNPAGCESGYFRAMPEAGRKVMRKVFYARRQAASAERRLSRYLARIGGQSGK